MKKTQLFPPGDCLEWLLVTMVVIIVACLVAGWGRAWLNWWLTQ